MYLSHGGTNLAEAVRNLYREGQTDYSIEPVVLVDVKGNPVGCIQDGDAVVFCCRRGEREIQLTEAFVEKDFEHFNVQRFQNLPFVILTLYHEKFKDLPVAFAPTKLKEHWAKLSARANLRQLRWRSPKILLMLPFLQRRNNQPSWGRDVRVASPKGSSLIKLQS
jgi:2,3-bisphosphoglycerate-independent phosphoglycerate mutase